MDTMSRRGPWFESGVMQVLRLKKAMEKVVETELDRVDSMDKLEAAAEATAVMDNQLR
jgi:hypothetical protein